MIDIPDDTVFGVHREHPEITSISINDVARLSPRALRVYILVKNEDMGIDTIPAIMKRLRCSRATVSRALGELRRLGLVTRYRSLDAEQAA